MPFCNLSQLFIVDIKKYIIIFVFFFSNIIKSEVIQFTKDSNKYDITSNIWVALVEKTDDFKIEYLSSLSDDSFNKNSNRYLEKEFNGKDLLIKFKIISNINKKYFLQINDPLIDYIDIIIYSKDRSYNYKSGWLVPINLRSIKDRKHIFELPNINIDQEFDIYIKLRKEDNISLTYKKDSSEFRFLTINIANREKNCIDFYGSNLNYFVKVDSLNFLKKLDNVIINSKSYNNVFKLKPRYSNDTSEYLLFNKEFGVLKINYKNGKSFSLLSID
jgi:hypothetical protein